nr:MAG TPA: hypothetical protein [Caudoviricetes sp.]
MNYNNIPLHNVKYEWVFVWNFITMIFFVQ